MIFNKKIVGCCLICILLIVTVFQFTGCASKEEIEENPRSRSAKVRN